MSDLFTFILYFWGGIVGILFVIMSWKLVLTIVGIPTVILLFVLPATKDFMLLIFLASLFSFVTYEKIKEIKKARALRRQQHA
jgi:hypothetical protein